MSLGIKAATGTLKTPSSSKLSAAVVSTSAMSKIVSGIAFLLNLHRCSFCLDSLRHNITVTWY